MEDERQHVSQVTLLYDQLYREGGVGQLDSAINRAVWTSSHDRRTLSEREILECVEDTCLRIRALKPRRILEIGCGTGLLLTRLVHDCEHYYGTDVSAEAVAQVTATIQGIAGLPGRVVLERRGANELTDLPDHGFDVVIINEVVQHFPSVDYLLRVLNSLSGLLAAEAHIFLGGIRSLPLLDAFYSSLHARECPTGLTHAHLRRAIAASRAAEKDLILAPELFASISDHVPFVTHAAIQLKGGRACNEITKFKYDVILGTGPCQDAPVEWISWRDERPNAGEMARHLRRMRPARVGWSNVSNARLTDERRILSGSTVRPECCQNPVDRAMAFIPTSYGSWSTNSLMTSAFSGRAMLSRDRSTCCFTSDSPRPIIQQYCPAICFRNTPRQ